MQRSLNWQPSATLETLKTRAALLATTRAFFAARDVLEVDTPLLAQCGVTDPHLENLQTELLNTTYYLQTSPEYAMKRLLAAGSGCIYQLSKVFRADEQSPRHNPEFTMLEWYRVGYSMQELIAEVGALLHATVNAPPLLQMTYQQLFLDRLGVDPLAPNALVQLQTELAQRPELRDWASAENDLDTLLEGAMALVIEPQLQPEAPLVVTHYPASQAALAQLDPSDQRVALRFEVFYGGLELANGYQELTDAALQAQRFAADNARRAQLGKAQRNGDARLLAALQQGMPACSGVALGFDRLAMLSCRKQHIAEILPFAIDRA
ncbi:EF-P lysine aminoacylase EpmA [Pseudidiomarina homiensis]|uniref:EF-P lysine aminoacylase EpmA n=1 Tax=Pseudidiomarina homiensis TaxID=364198 RepID=UPI00215B6E8D|nr:EF-P lysine aminoacylase EpmA [Pseudidiomarina homiensis]